MPGSKIVEEEEEDDEPVEFRELTAKKVVISMKDLKEKQKVLRSFPALLLQTLFNDNPSTHKYRNADFSQLYFFADEIKTMGNNAYQTDNLYHALEFYEEVRTQFRLLFSV